MKDKRYFLRLKLDGSFELYEYGFIVAQGKQWTPKVSSCVTRVMLTREGREQQEMHYG